MVINWLFYNLFDTYFFDNDIDNQCDTPKINK
jgi:hypothetical protein